MTNATENQMEYLKDLINKMQNGSDVNARICKLMEMPSELTKDQASELINIFKNNPYHNILLSALKKSTVMNLLGEKFNNTFNAMSSAKSKVEAISILEAAEKVEEPKSAKQEAIENKGRIITKKSNGFILEQWYFNGVLYNLSFLPVNAGYFGYVAISDEGEEFIAKEGEELEFFVKNLPSLNGKAISEGRKKYAGLFKK